MHVLFCLGKKKTQLEDMAKHGRMRLKLEHFLRLFLPAAKKKPVQENKPGRGAFGDAKLHRPAPPRSSPLGPRSHTSLRTRLGAALRCRADELPCVRLYPTAKHPSGIVHATKLYYGGPW